MFDIVLLNIFDVNNPVILGLPKTEPENTMGDPMILYTARLPTMMFIPLLLSILPEFCQRNKHLKR